MTEDELKAIEERDSARTPGFWRWAREYGLGRTQHWCIISSTSEEGTCIDGELVTHTDSQYDHCMSDDPLDPRILCDRPNWQFIVQASVDIPALIKEVRECWEVIHDLQIDSEAYQHGIKVGLAAAFLEFRAADVARNLLPSNAQFDVVAFLVDRFVPKVK